MSFFGKLFAGILELGGAVIGVNPHTQLDGTEWETNLHGAGEIVQHFL
jgi:hypothetical protein